ncbi:MAG: hypothetical protein KGN00_06965 [Chloroflexota bacterium]|nr:hypothetical protein [Chloroflexota bacterium]
MSQQRTPSASPTPAAAATATVAPTPAPSPSPTPDRAAEDAMQLLALRDEAQVKGDEKALSGLLDDNASPEFHAREVGLLHAAHDRGAAAPKRTFLGRAEIAGEAVQAIEVAEDDDQGRTRRVRYFFSFACCTRLTEPTSAELDAWLGPLRTLTGNGYSIRYRDIDADEAHAADGYARDALTSLPARLGDTYRLSRPLTITLAPTTISALPAQASGYTNGGEVTLLSSASMIVASGPGADWARIVVTHEISHVLLFAHGNGPWALAEGIPLWLTGDRRQPQLDRLVAANAIWDLPHLQGGPRADAEFYAAYAQASSFVRYLAATYGDRAVVAAWEAGSSGRSVDATFRTAFGVGVADAYAGWRASLRPSALVPSRFARAA